MKYECKACEQILDSSQCGEHIIPSEKRSITICPHCNGEVIQVAVTDTNEQCRAIIEKIVEIADKGGSVHFIEDFGGNTLTIEIDGSHTHVGCPGGSFETLVDNLYNTLHGGPGLSWACDSKLGSYEKFFRPTANSFLNEFATLAFWTSKDSYLRDFPDENQEVKEYTLAEIHGYFNVRGKNAHNDIELYS